MRTPCRQNVGLVIWKTTDYIIAMKAHLGKAGFVEIANETCYQSSHWKRLLSYDEPCNRSIGLNDTHECQRCQRLEFFRESQVGETYVIAPTPKLIVKVHKHERRDRSIKVDTLLKTRCIVPNFITALCPASVYIDAKCRNIYERKTYTMGPKRQPSSYQQPRHLKVPK